MCGQGRWCRDRPTEMGKPLRTCTGDEQPVAGDVVADRIGQEVSGGVAEASIDVEVHVDPEAVAPLRPSDGVKRASRRPHRRVGPRDVDLSVVTTHRVPGQCLFDDRRRAPGRSRATAGIARRRRSERTPIDRLGVSTAPRPARRPGRKRPAVRHDRRNRRPDERLIVGGSPDLDSVWRQVKSSRGRGGTGTRRPNGEAERPSASSRGRSRQYQPTTGLAREHRRLIERDLPAFECCHALGQLVSTAGDVSESSRTTAADARTRTPVPLDRPDPIARPGARPVEELTGHHCEASMLSVEMPGNLVQFRLRSSTGLIAVSCKPTYVWRTHCRMSVAFVRYAT